MTQVRTRFAPSPTGFLHIGGARTALYCWLYARKTNGKFVLRIEDTDLERSTPQSVQAILDGMNWLSLNWDEGPFYQTEHFDRYKQVIANMLEAGTAYKCYCSKERIDKLRREQMENKQKPRYDGHCRKISAHQEGLFVVRFKNPEGDVVEFDDLIRGKITFANTELDDLIIARSDGTPTYNFTVVIDDWDMKITHVIRGDDHVNNTPRQINILRALGATPPKYAHVPMILGPDGKRLSKRHGAEGVMQYRDEGFLPEALLNYLARLGWSHGDQEIFSIKELIELFEIENINRAPAAFNIDKLLWLNQHYMKTADPAYVADALAWHMHQQGIDCQTGPALTDIVKVQCERTKTLKEMAERSRYFYEDVEINSEMKKQFTPDILPVLKHAYDALANLSEWSKEAIHGVLNSSAEAAGLKLGKLAQPMRIALTGGTVSPSLDITMQLLGKECVRERLQKVLLG